MAPRYNQAGGIGIPPTDSSQPPQQGNAQVIKHSLKPHKTSSFMPSSTFDCL